MEAVPLDAIMGQPTLNSVRHLVEQLTAFASHFATTEWGGKHGFLLIVLTNTKILIAARNQNIECERIENPELLNPKIEDDTKGRKLIQFQEDHKVKWQEYTFQEVVDSVTV